MIYCISGVLFNGFMFHSEVDHICLRNILDLGLPILSFPVSEPRVSGITERFLNSITSINPFQKSLSQQFR